MSFAEDMGHDMPPGYDCEVYAGGYSGSGYYSQHSYTPRVTTYTDIAVNVVKETEKAWMCSVGDDPINRWCPKSQCTLNINRNTLKIPDWLLSAWAS